MITYNFGVTLNGEAQRINIALGVSEEFLKHLAGVEIKSSLGHFAYPDVLEDKDLIMIRDILVSRGFSNVSLNRETIPSPGVR